MLKLWRPFIVAGLDVNIGLRRPFGALEFDLPGERLDVVLPLRVFAALGEDVDVGDFAVGVEAGQGDVDVLHVVGLAPVVVGDEVLAVLTDPMGRGTWPSTGW